MQHFEQAVWGGHFDAIRCRLLRFLVAPESLHGSGFCFKRAIMNFSLTECKTWSVFYSGDICLTSTSTDCCLELPPAGFVTDGTPKNLQREEDLWEYVGTIKKTMLVHKASLCRNMALASATINACKHEQSHSCTNCCH